MHPACTRWLNHPLWPCVAGGLAMLVALPSLWTGLLLDDYLHRAAFLGLPGFGAGALQIFSFISPDGAHEPHLFALPWWAASDLKLSFWRPVTALTHALDYALWPDAPWLMHLQSVLWYAALVVLAGVLFRRLLEVQWRPGLATLAYAVSPTHAMPIFFIANRNALLGAFGCVATLLLHHRWRRHGGRLASVMGPLALLLGLLSNEGAVATCAYLFAYALFIDKGTPRQRAMSLTGYALTVVGWRGCYQALGHGAWASEAYIDPVASPGRFLEATAIRGPVYLLGQWLVPPSDLSSLVSSSTFVKWWLGAMVFFAVLIVFLYPLLRREATSRFWCMGMLLSLIPVCATYPMDRMLMYSGIGAAALLSQFLVAVYRGELLPPHARVRRVAARVLFDLFLVLHIIAAPVWLPLRIHTTAAYMDKSDDPIGDLARRRELAGKLVVLIDDTRLSSGYFPALRALADREPVRRLLLLASLTSAVERMTLSRPSENTLIVDIDGGYEWFLVRDREHPFATGDTIPGDRVTVKILQVSDDGRPTSVAFDFDTPLEDDSIAWFMPGPSESRLPAPLEPFVPPPVGRATVLR